MRSTSILALAFIAPAVLGRVLSPRQSAPPTCVINCIGASASVTSCASSDATCLCISSQFIDATAACMISTCTPAEATIGAQYGAAFCSTVGVTVTIPTNLQESTAAGAASTSAAAEASTTSAAASSSSVVSSSRSSSAPASQSSAPASSAPSSSAPASSTSAAPSATPTSGASKTLTGTTVLAVAGVAAAYFL